MQNDIIQPNIQPSSRDILNILFKQKKKIFFFFFIVMSIVCIIAILSPKIYKSEAKLFIKLGRETVTQNSDSSPGQRISVSQSLENQINSEIEILKSQELALKLVEKMGIESFQQSSTKYLQENNPLFMKLHPILRKFNEMSEKIASFFLIQSKPEESQSVSNEALKIADQITKNLQAKVINDSNIIKLSYESVSPVLARDILNQLISLYMGMHIKLLSTPESYEFFQKESNKFLLQLEATEKKIQKLKNEIGSGYATSAINELNNVLYEQKLKEQDLLYTFTETSIPVKEIRKQIQKTESQIEAQLKANNEAEVRLLQLQREKELLEKNYRKYADALEQTRIDRALEAEKISNIRIAQAPYVPLEPIRPQTGIVLLLGFFLAIFGGLGLAFFSEYMDGSLQRPEQIEKLLDIPVLGSIQEMRK